MNTITMSTNITTMIMTAIKMSTIMNMGKNVHAGMTTAMNIIMSMGRNVHADADTTMNTTITMQTRYLQAGA